MGLSQVLVPVAGPVLAAHRETTEAEIRPPHKFLLRPWSGSSSCCLRNSSEYFFFRLELLAKIVRESSSSDAATLRSENVTGFLLQLKYSEPLTYHVCFS